MNIRLSVIIPAYNQEDNIEKCIKSVMSQEIKELEIIVINDGSTDKTKDIILKLVQIDKRIILINKKNGGLTSARNTGLERAKGNYIIHLDGDDYIEKNAYKKMLIFAEKNNLDGVICDFYLDYIENKDKNKKISIDFISKKEKEILESSIYLKNLFQWNSVAPAVWNKMIKKDIYKNFKINFPQNIFLGEDLCTTVKLIFNCRKLGKINEPLINYVQHRNQGSSNLKISENILDLFKVYDIIRSYFEKNDLDRRYLSLINESEINGVYVKFLRVPSSNLIRYIEARKLFFLNLNRILAYEEIKKIKLKNRIRLKLLKLVKSRKLLKIL